MNKYDSLTNIAVTFGDGGENSSGIGEAAYFIPLSWLATVAKPTIAATSESVAKITGNHVMKAGKAPILVNALYDKSGLSWKGGGEKMSKIMEQGGEVFIPYNSVSNMGSIAVLKNMRGILLVSKMDDTGHFWQIGSEQIGATFTDMAGGTGVGPTGEVGTKLTIQSYGPVGAWSYEGELPVAG